MERNSYLRITKALRPISLSTFADISTHNDVAHDYIGPLRKTTLVRDGGLQAGSLTYQDLHNGMMSVVAFNFSFSGPVTFEGSVAENSAIFSDEKLDLSLWLRTIQEQSNRHIQSIFFSVQAHMNLPQIQQYIKVHFHDTRELRRILETKLISPVLIIKPEGYFLRDATPLGTTVPFELDLSASIVERLGIKGRFDQNGDKTELRVNQQSFGLNMVLGHKLLPDFANRIFAAGTTFLTEGSYIQPQ